MSSSSLFPPWLQLILAVLAPTAAFLGVLVAARMTRRNDHNKHIREMRAEAYQDFLVRTHDLMVLRGQALSGHIRSIDKIQESLSGHRTSGTAVQLLAADPRLIALVDDMVKGAGADFKAALDKANSDRVVTGDHFTQLMSAMRRELGVPTRRRGFISKIIPTTD